ncbi:MAG: mechanosensitive ion channel [Thermoplasmata archaeon]|nr:mechanosensitive ion channel [Thermoplasmata archaeon]TFG69936.1 MAG: mechanosensitive ion channel family protein [Methanomassiliicoccus sp.]
MNDGERYEDHRHGAVFAVVFVLIVAVLLLLELRHGIIPVLYLTNIDGDTERLLIAIIAISVTWLVLHNMRYLFEKITIPKVGSHAQARSMWRLLSTAVWIFVLITLVLTLIGEVTSLILYVGLIGAALTLILQKPLLNIGAWALVTYKRLYRIGDRIAIGGVKGYVLDITAMYTELREFGEWMKGDTFTGRIVTIPNGLIFDQPLHNYTRDFPFIWDEIVNLVTYESDIELAKKYMIDSAKEIVGELMAKNYELYRRKLEIRDLDQLLLKEPEYRMELSDSGVNIYVLYFCPVETRRKIKAQITELIWKRFMADPRVGIAYPHMHVVGDVNHEHKT